MKENVVKVAVDLAAVDSAAGGSEEDLEEGKGVPMEARIETVTWQRSTLTHPPRGSLPVGCFLCSKGC